MKQALSLVLSCALATSAFAAPAPQATTSDTTTTTKTTTKKHRKAAAPSVSRQIEDLKEEMNKAIAAEQQQILLLQQQIQTRDQALQQMQQRLDQSQTTATEAAGKADAVSTQVGAQQQQVVELKSDLSDIKQNSTNTAVSLQETQKNITDALESPIALHYKGITITPVGFLAAETVWRKKALAADQHSVQRDSLSVQFTV
jgi:phosphoenolpyruvate-protein kinase (PTS system EI component)